MRLAAVCAAGAFLWPCAAPAQQAFVSGRVVDRATARTLGGVAVAIAPDTGENAQALAGDRPPADAATVRVTVTDPDGGFVVPLPQGARYVLAAFGAPLQHATFHGEFDARTRDLGTLGLTAVSNDERAALQQLNRFRAAPGGNPNLAAPAAALVVDENLTESAQFWAAQEARAGRIGHTCAALGNPPSCIEFNAYFHRLRGAPQDWYAGQNAAFDTVSSWTDPSAGFEEEGRRCVPAYDWRRCGAADNDAVGHFVNVMTARRWVGFGETRQPGIGAYYALNVI